MSMHPCLTQGALKFAPAHTAHPCQATHLSLSASQEVHEDTETFLEYLSCHDRSYGFGPVRAGESQSQQV